MLSDPDATVCPFHCRSARLGTPRVSGSPKLPQDFEDVSKDRTARLLPDALAGEKACGDAQAAARDGFTDGKSTSTSKATFT